MIKLIVFAVVVLAAAAFATSAALAQGGDREVIKSGSCSGAAAWKLKAKADDGRIETEFEVDQNRVGRKWHVVIKQNGIVRADVVKTTQAPSGSFEVRRLLPNMAGGDFIVAKATALATGQTCRGALTF
jgi:hypothetical protein